MYTTKFQELRENYTYFHLMHKPGMNMRIHWLNPLLFKRKDR